MFKGKKEAMGAAYKNASMPARMLGLIAIVGLVALLIFIRPFGGVSRTEQLQDDYNDFKDANGANIGTFGNVGDQANPLIIEDPNSEPGKLALQADAERVKKAQKEGVSVIAALTPVTESPSTSQSMRDKLQALIAANGGTNTDEETGNKDAAWITQPVDRPGTDATQTSVPSSAPAEESASSGSTYREPVHPALAGLTPEQINMLLTTRKAKAAAKLNELGETAIDALSKTSGGFVPYQDAKSTTVASTENSTSAGFTNIITGAAATNPADKAKDAPVLVPQGKMLSAHSGFPIDSRFNKKFVLEINTGKLKGATLSCSYTRTDDYLIPVCPEMTFQGESVSVSTVMLNPETMGPVVDQDIDSSPLLDTLGLIATGAAMVYGENKLRQGTTVETTDTSTTVSTGLSDSELIAGSVATVVGTLNAVAMQNFNKDRVITVPANNPMMVAFLEPLRANWKLKTEPKAGVDYYD